MILQALHELYDRLEREPFYKIVSPGFSLQKISFRVVVRPDGTLFDIQDARTSDENRIRPVQIRVLGSTKPTGSALNPCFLWDNSSYMLGYKYEDPKPDRTAKAFLAFREKHLALEETIHSSPYQAVCRFLAQWDPDTAIKYPVLQDPTIGFGVFQILGETSYVHEDAEVLKWWKSQFQENETGEIGQCLVTGADSPIARLHQKIKGVAGGQSAGTSLVGFNLDAFTSYGKDQSFNAPVSEDAAFRYTTALNALLDGPGREKHRLLVGDMTLAFWTDRPSPVEDIFALFTSAGSGVLEGEKVQDETLRKKLETLLKALREGRESYGELDDNPEQTRFYILGLSPNAARASVRFFYSNTLSALLDNLRKHVEDIRIRGGPRDPECPTIWQILAQTAREAKEAPPVLEGPLLKAVIAGYRYPPGLYQAVIRRLHMERNVTYLKACIIKAYLMRNHGKEITMSLNHESKEPAYRLGRLFSALEKTQLDALGPGLSSTIREKFYSSASATPGTVFPRLLRTYQHHLAKMEGGRKIYREKLVQEILDPIEAFPTHLNLTEQGLFALGYYHQTRDFYTKHDAVESAKE